MELKIGGRTTSVTRDYLLPGVASLTLFCSALVAPPTGVLVSMLSPLPLVFVYILNGRWAAVGVMVGIAATVAGLASASAAAVFLAEHGLMAAVIGEGVLMNASAARIVFMGSLFPLAAGGLAAYTAASIRGIDLLETIEKEITRILDTSIAAYREVGTPTAEIDLIAQNADMIVKTVMSLMPSMAYIGVCAAVLMNYGLFRLFYVRINPSLPAPGDDLRLWRSPEKFVFVFILAGFAMALGITGPAEPVALNAFIVAVFVYMLQGLAVLQFFLGKSGIPSLVRLLIYALLVFQPLLLAPVAMTGLADLWLDFRRLTKPALAGSEPDDGDNGGKNEDSRE